MLIPKMLESIMSLLNTLMSMLSMMMQKLPAASVPANAGASAGASANSNGGSAAAGAGASANGTGASAGAAAGATGNGSTASANASAGTSATNTTQPSAGAGALTPSTLNVLRNDAGQIAVSTFDGYVIRTEGKDMAWTITGPDGKTTRIWGDPHVDESDGNKWDFLNRSTFFFGKNKVTVEVAPYGNGQTVTSRITIYSGDERVTIGGIDKNIPTILASSNDAEQHDLALADGISYTRGADAKGESWTSNQTNAVVGAAA
jgi:hypothetical protein